MTVLQWNITVKWTIENGTFLIRMILPISSKGPCDRICLIFVKEETQIYSRQPVHEANITDSSQGKNSLQENLIYKIEELLDLNDVHLDPGKHNLTFMVIF